MMRGGRMAVRKITGGFMVGEELALEYRDGFLRIVLAGMLMGCSRVTPGSAPALRALADLCDEVCPAPAKAAERDLFDAP